MDLLGTIPVHRAYGSVGLAGSSEEVQALLRPHEERLSHFNYDNCSVLLLHSPNLADFPPR